MEGIEEKSRFFFIGTKKSTSLFAKNGLGPWNEVLLKLREWETERISF